MSGIADVVWPALIVTSRLLAWPPIVVGLVAEILVLVFAFKMPAKLAVMAGIAMNFVSTVLGTVLIPIAGVAWEIFPGFVIYPLLDVGTFNPLTWSATFVLAVLVNSLLELLVLTVLFETPWNRRTLMFLALANTVSVALAYASFLYKPIEL